MPCDLILALDVPKREQADPILRQLSGSVRWVKIGLQMFTAYGPDYVRAVADQGFNVFLDLKLHDIPNTVAKAIESLAPLPIGMLTLHTGGGREMMVAAKEAQEKTKPGLLLLGVTVLTSMDAIGLSEIGVPDTPGAQVDRLAHLAVDSGLSGLVCSPLEVASLRRRFALNPDLKLVTPGIRPVDDATSDDQKRVMSPSEAAQSGANFIVVGRPILKARDPAAAARAVLSELQASSS